MRCASARGVKVLFISLTRYTPAMQGEGRSAATAWERRGGGLAFAGGSGTYAIIEA